MMIVVWAAMLFMDYLMMVFVATKLGLAERIACVVMMVLHFGLFLGYIYLKFLKKA